MYSFEDVQYLHSSFKFSVSALHEIPPLIERKNGNMKVRNQLLAEPLYRVRQ